MRLPTNTSNQSRLWLLAFLTQHLVVQAVDDRSGYANYGGQANFGNFKYMQARPDLQPGAPGYFEELGDEIWQATGGVISNLMDDPEKTLKAFGESIDDFTYNPGKSIGNMLQQCQHDAATATFCGLNLAALFDGSGELSTEAILGGDAESGLGKIVAPPEDSSALKTPTTNSDTIAGGSDVTQATSDSSDLKIAAGGEGTENTGFTSTSPATGGTTFITGDNVDSTGFITSTDVTGPQPVSVNPESGEVSPPLGNDEVPTTNPPNSDLTGLDLNKADKGGSNLSDSSESPAIDSGASKDSIPESGSKGDQLSHTGMTGADWTGADISGSELSGSNLDGTVSEGHPVDGQSLEFGESVTGLDQTGQDHVPADPYLNGNEEEFSQSGDPKGIDDNTSEEFGMDDPCDETSLRRRDFDDCTKTWQKWLDLSPQDRSIVIKNLGSVGLRPESFWHQWLKLQKASKSLGREEGEWAIITNPRSEGTTGLQNAILAIEHRPKFEPQAMPHLDNEPLPTSRGIYEYITAFGEKRTGSAQQAVNALNSKFKYYDDPEYATLDASGNPIVISQEKALDNFKKERQSWLKVIASDAVSQVGNDVLKTTDDTFHAVPDPSGSSLWRIKDMYGITQTVNTQEAVAIMNDKFRFLGVDTEALIGNDGEILYRTRNSDLKIEQYRLEAAWNWKLWRPETLSPAEALKRANDPIAWIRNRENYATKNIDNFWYVDSSTGKLAYRPWSLEEKDRQFILDQLKAKEKTMEPSQRTMQDKDVYFDLDAGDFKVASPKLISEKKSRWQDAFKEIQVKNAEAKAKKELIHWFYQPHYGVRALPTPLAMQVINGQYAQGQIPRMKSLNSQFQVTERSLARMELKQNAQVINETKNDGSSSTFKWLNFDSKTRNWVSVNVTKESIANRLNQVLNSFGTSNVTKPIRHAFIGPDNRLVIANVNKIMKNTGSSYSEAVGMTRNLHRLHFQTKWTTNSSLIWSSIEDGNLNQNVDPDTFASKMNEWESKTGSIVTMWNATSGKIVRYRFTTENGNPTLSYAQKQTIIRNSLNRNYISHPDSSGKVLYIGNDGKTISLPLSSALSLVNDIIAIPSSVASTLPAIRSSSSSSAPAPGPQTSSSPFLSAAYPSSDGSIEVTSTSSSPAFSASISASSTPSSSSAISLSVASISASASISSSSPNSIVGSSISATAASGSPRSSLASAASLFSTSDNSVLISSFPPSVMLSLSSSSVFRSFTSSSSSIAQSETLPTPTVTRPSIATASSSSPSLRRRARSRNRNTQ